jgi:DNA-binding GntR family transcriptional regulator
VSVQPIRVDSVVELAYERIRGMIVGDQVRPGARLGQGELAEQLGISRTSVREALRRLTGDGLVEFHTNRGFFVADVGLDAVLHRLEVRLLLEPGIARCASERRTEADLAALAAAIADERDAPTAELAHDASRALHVALARATQNEELVRTLESLWIVEVGRRLLARRAATVEWQANDVADHERIADAVSRSQGEEAARLMRLHIEEALQHWTPGAEAAHEVSEPRAAGASAPLPS